MAEYEFVMANNVKPATLHFLPPLAVGLQILGSRFKQGLLIFLQQVVLNSIKVRIF